jgi:hypothetical protein
VPTGRTTKKTMTSYRATLLRRLQDGSIARLSVTATERRQFNELASFGWVIADGSNYALTRVGRERLESFQLTLAAA